MYKLNTAHAFSSLSVVVLKFSNIQFTILFMELGILQILKFLQILLESILIKQNTLSTQSRMPMTQAIDIVVQFCS